MKRYEISEETFKQLERKLDAIDSLSKAIRTMLSLAETKHHTPQPTNHHLPWSPEEFQTLRHEWEMRLPIEDIALQHGRSPGGIAAALVKLGLIRNKEEVLGPAESPREGADDAPVERGEGSGPMPGRNVNVVQTGEKTLFITPPAPSVLDFAGAWRTENDSRAQVAERRKDGAWEGFVAGAGVTIWDEEGKNEDPKLSLKERVREGKDYR